ncbi:MAG: hypothetical protein ACW99Q_14445 [Candidatus Kariarchaeaceae archaeon]|jgi:hypothetical protein
MKKPQTVTFLSILLVVALASYLYITIGPCSKPKISEGHSRIAEILLLWEEILIVIESPESTGISKGRVDSMEHIKRQTATVIVPQCMFKIKQKLYYGMETRIRAYSAILDKGALLDEINSAQNAIPITGNSINQVDVKNMQNQLSEIEYNVEKLFIASNTYMVDFNLLFAKLSNLINSKLPPWVPIWLRTIVS